MSFTLRKVISPFTCLNVAQFASSLNDNIYKLLLVFFLISEKGIEHSNTILALAGAVFVVPFIIFAALAGTLADRYSKRTIIFITRFTEIGIVSLGVVAFAVKSGIFGYTVLFLMATQSSFFSPVKYGIIPEIVKKQKVSHFNGLITATTYLAIIIGTFLGSFLTEITHKNFVLSALVCLVIATIGTLFTLGIPKTEAQAKEKKVSARFFSVIYQTLKRSLQTRYLFTTIVVGAYFLFIGAYTQLNIIPFAVQSLHLTDVEGGYLFLMTAVGIGIGSFLAGRLSGKNVELGFVPLACLGISLAALFLFILSSYLIPVVIVMVCLGLFGGFFIVPIDAYIQVASPPQDRGQNVAASNFLSFGGVIIASGLLALLGNVIGFSAAEGFFVIAILTSILTVLLFLTMADQVLRLIVGWISLISWNLTVKGEKNLRLYPPVLLVGERLSWLDTIVVMATLPRMLRYVVPIQGRFLRGRSFFYRLVRLIPIDVDHFSPIGELTLNAIQKEIDLGHSICLMLPVMTGTNGLKEWEEKIQGLLHNVETPVIPVYIDRVTPKEGASYIEQAKTLFKHPITVSYGAKQETGETND